MAIAKLNTKYPEIEADGLTYLYGVKVDRKWFFFDGPYLAVPREFYQKDTSKPLSVEILKSIAMEEIFRGYLKKNKQSGELEINDGFFASLTGNGGCADCKTQAQWDSVYLATVRENWKNRDTSTYHPLQ
ncbi:hypothetical protein [Dyadobacter sp. 32]|uniref:hypothetical protein n=1 Tax=Dyadobacter sp. 32 TaxID=538966 RepID=UPI0011EBEC01